ncbi:Hypothetical protein A7982_07628 [Minicystis rosea]|nr:Hypothetical protein A7982_07628 [Minicystis rosea]
MNRLIALAPFALLTTACAVRTPATALDLDRQDALPDTHTVELPAESEVLASWQLPAQTPWSRYEKLTLLTYLADQPVTAEMPDVAALDVVQQAKAAAERLALVGLPSDTLWIVDLRGAASVAFGSTLSRYAMARVAPVLTFNNWPAENEVVPAEQTLAALVSMRPKPLAATDERVVPVFLLDAWRLARRDETPDPEAVDNRYMLLQSDFPDAATLRSMGISRVIYVVEDRDETTTEEDDVHDVALDYQSAGIGLSLVDLETLASLGGVDSRVAMPAWDVWLSDWSYRVEWRSTILDDPAFYGRARGGFGGVRATPGGHRAYGGAHPSVGGSHGHSHTPHGGHHGGHHGGRIYSGATPHVSGHGGG